MADPAVRAIAAHEWQRRRWALLLVGVMTGVICGALLVGLELTRRTATAPERMIEAVRPGHAQIDVFGDRELLERALALPAVRESWRGALAVGRIEGVGSVQYSGVLAPLQPEGTSPLLRPVLIDGRLPAPGRHDEVLVTEEYAEVFGADVGGRLELAMLTAEEVSQFDVGFGEPDGPRLELTVVGVARVANGLLRSSPIMTSPGFAELHPEVVAGFVGHAELRGGAGALGAYRAAVVDAVAGMAGGGGDFLPINVEDPRDGTRQLQRSSRILVGAMWLAVVVGAIAAAVALGQTLARHQSSSVQQQRTEAALGMTAQQRVAARVIAAVPMALVAALIAAVLAVGGGWFEPVGGLHDAEPHRGHRVDALVLIGGPVIVGVGVVIAVALAVLRAGRPHASASPSPRSRAWALAPRRGGWPLAGVAFAMSTGGAARRLPVRTSLAGAVFGVAGLTAGVVFTSSMDRLVETPSRFGWTADAAIADARDEHLDELLADPRIESVVDVQTSDSVVVDGVSTDAYAYRPLRGTIEWVLLDGRLGRADDEVVLGTRLASRIGARVGDEVRLVDQRTRQTFPVRIVGVGLGPNITGDGLGESLLVTPTTLARVAPTSGFRNAVFVVDASRADPAVVIAELGERYEVQPRFVPREVDDVVQLGSLPMVLGGFLAALAALALSHALVVTARERARDLAVLRAVGATPRQTGLALVAMALATTALGIMFGVPIGWAIARFAWGELARSIGVRGDVVVRPATVLVVAGALAVAALLAIVPARRATRTSAAGALRDE